MNADQAYEFSVDWFSPNIPTWDMLLPQVKPRRLLEIGSYEGRSTCYLIERCAQDGAIEFHCVDSWEGGVEHQAGAVAASAMNEVERRFDRNTAIAQAKAAHEVTLVKHKKYSNLALADLVARGESGKFDLVFVDGSHQAPDVLTDAVLGFQLLRVGGLMVFDDYLWHIEPLGRQDSLNMPKPAIDAFFNIFQRKMRIIPRAPLGQIYANKVLP